MCHFDDCAEFCEPRLQSSPFLQKLAADVDYCQRLIVEQRDRPEWHWVLASFLRQRTVEGIMAGFQQAGRGGGTLYIGQRNTLQPIVVTPGPFNSIWIRIAGLGAHSLLTEVLAEASRKSMGAVYVLSSLHNLDGVAKILHDQNFKFHHQRLLPGVSGHPAPDGNNAAAAAAASYPLVSGEAVQETQFVFYKWVGAGPDMVMPHCTRPQTVGAVLMSPDGLRVLLVHEADAVWRPAHTVILAGETHLDAIARAVSVRQLPLVVTTATRASVVGAYNRVGRGEDVADGMYTWLLVHAEPTPQRAPPPPHSVFPIVGGHARWFDVDALLAILKLQYGAAYKAPARGFDGSTMSSDGNLVDADEADIPSSAIGHQQIIRVGPDDYFEPVLWMLHRYRSQKNGMKRIERQWDSSAAEFFL